MTELTKTFLRDEDITVTEDQQLRNTGERQVGDSIDKIAPDHRLRYQWAARWLRGQLGAEGRVMDLGCGNGYGTYILASYGLRAVGIDRCAEAIDFAKMNYAHPKAAFAVADLETFKPPAMEAVVCFEVIEHLEDDFGLLKRISVAARHAVISVPNQDVVPFSLETHPFHLRHYTANELDDLLGRAGLNAVEFLTQYDKWKGDVKSGRDGRTLIIAAERTEI